MKLTDIDYSERVDMEDFIKWGVEPVRMLVDILQRKTNLTYQTAKEWSEYWRSSWREGLAKN